MIAFEVKDMTCGHCVSTITKALKATDKDAKVQIDLATHHVRVEPVSADAEDLAEAIKEAGYTPVSVEAKLKRSCRTAGVGLVVDTASSGNRSSRPTRCCGWIFVQRRARRRVGARRGMTLSLAAATRVG
jgi:copper chaperone